jgi:nucleotide sugar dehydrogenase
MNMPYDLSVIGLGYVGLPLVREACAAGLRVAALDTDTGIVASLRAGKSHVDDVSDEDVAAILAAGADVTADRAVLADTRAAVICVPTPLGPDHRPDLTAVESACRDLAAHLRPGTLVVLESTSYPGTTDEVVRPLLEGSGLLAGADFHLAFSPERIDPGNPRFQLRNTPKVIGGLTTACAERAHHLYSRIVDTVVLAKGTREAEMAKILENTFRLVNIALVNELAQLSHDLEVDMWDAIDCAATKPFGFQAFYPGPGVGGHCIPIDPHYLTSRLQSLGRRSRVVELAQEINEGMPAYVCRRAMELLNEDGKPLRGARVLLLGVTYKADVADVRESPAATIAGELLRRGAEVRYHDPYVEGWHVLDQPMPRVSDVAAASGDSDLTVLVQAHREYLRTSLKLAGRVLDTRAVLANGVTHRL